MTDLRKAAEMALDLIQSEYSIYGENKYLPNDVIEALEQALAQPNAGEGVDGSVRVFIKSDGEWERVDSYEKALNALAQPEQEPVAWQYQEYRSAFMGNLQWFDTVQFVQPPNDPEIFRNIKPLYTALPKREWVGLTNEEVDAIRNNIFEKYKKALFVTRDVTSENDYSAFNFYRAIEEKLRSKNDF